MDQILTNLYLGSNWDVFTANKLIPRPILVCVAEYLPDDSSAEVNHIPVLHNGSIVMENISKVCKMAHENISNNRPILIQCAFGIECGPLVVAWYLHTYNDMTLDEAYTMIKKIRPIASDRRNWLPRKEVCQPTTEGL